MENRERLYLSIHFKYGIRFECPHKLVDHTHGSSHKKSAWNLIMCQVETDYHKFKMNMPVWTLKWARRCDDFVYALSHSAIFQLILRIDYLEQHVKYISHQAIHIDVFFSLPIVQLIDEIDEVSYEKPRGDDAPDDDWFIDRSLLYG